MQSRLGCGARPARRYCSPLVAAEGYGKLLRARTTRALRQHGYGARVIHLQCCRHYGCKLGHGSGACARGTATLFSGRRSIGGIVCEPISGNGDEWQCRSRGPAAPNNWQHWRARLTLHRAGRVTSATGSCDLSSAFPARSVAVPHPTRQESRVDQLEKSTRGWIPRSRLCEAARLPRSRVRGAGQAVRSTRSRSQEPRPECLCPRYGARTSRGPQQAAGGGMPPQPSSTRGRAKSIRSERTDRHLRRRRAAPQCFAQRGASELAGGGGNNNTSSKDPGHPPC